MRLRGALPPLFAVLLGLQVLAAPVYAQSETCPAGQTPDGQGGCAAALADLVAAAIDIGHQDIRAGEIVPLFAQVRNEGQAPAEFVVAFYIDGMEHTRLSALYLEANGSMDLEVDWQAIDGPHQYRFQVDPDGAVNESEQANNALEMSLNVAAEETTYEVWIECRDGRSWEIQQHPDGTRTETEMGPCETQKWIVDEWCDADGRRQVQYEHSDGHREIVVEGRCGDTSEPTEPYPGDWEDPYGCDGADGEWWDHHLARCVSEAAWDLQERFFRCTEEAHRSIAQDQKAIDIQMREQRHERRDREMQAMELEREGRYDEARAVWDDLRRLEWEEQKQFHSMQERIVAAVDRCIDDFAQEARANGWDYLVDEFEMHRIHALGDMPPPMMAEPGMACPPPGQAMPYPDAAQGSGGFHQERGYPEDGAGGMARHDPGPCGPDEDRHIDDHAPEPAYGLPPEAMAAMEEARQWCEEQRWTIESRMFEAETYEEASAIEEELRDVDRQCREKMEAVFGAHDRGYENEFDQNFGSFRMTEGSGGIDVRGANTWFTGKPEDVRLVDFTCRGIATIELVQPYFDLEDVHPVAEHKLGMFAGAHDPAIVVHDDPRCTVGIKPENAYGQDTPEVKVRFPSLYTCAAETQITCTDGEGTILVVRGAERPVLVDERTVIVRAAVDIRLAGGEGAAPMEAYEQHEAFGGTAAVAVKSGEVMAQAVSLGDLEMVVQAGDAEDSLKVSLSRESHVGSFVVLALEESVFATCDVDVQGWDVTEGQKQGLELREARDLTDALDTAYDGDWVKYYAVEDAHGCQVILTNSHFSEKEFLLSAASAAPGGIEVPGTGLLLVGIGMTVLVALVRRRH